MRNFQDAFETSKRSFISAFSIYMTVPLKSLSNPFIFSEGTHCMKIRLLLGKAVVKIFGKYQEKHL